MLNIGAHLTISKGYESAVKQAISINANTFQFFTRNPRGAKARDLNLVDIKKADQLCKNHDFAPLLAHAPYTYNFASNNDQTWELAKRLLRDDLDRLQHMESCGFIALHPGSHVGQGSEYGINRIIDGLNQILTGDENTMILLEGMSGKGSEIGGKFEELSAIINGIKHPGKVGVCLDTCHLYSAGYNIIESLDEVMNEFDRTIGLHRVKAVHLNDTMEAFGSHKDRHAKVGQGNLGLEGILRFIKNPAISMLPIFLETPNEVEGYQEEIALIRSYIKKE